MTTKNVYVIVVKSDERPAAPAGGSVIGPFPDAAGEPWSAFFATFPGVVRTTERPS